MASKEPKMSKQGDPDNIKHVTLKTLLKLETFWRLESSKSHIVMISVYSFGMSTLQDMQNHKDQYDPLWHQVSSTTTGNETAKITPNGQGVVPVVYSNAF
jgi:hypothetical protein